MPASPPALDELRRHPNALAIHYSQFRVSERILLSGHSHQAWPDRAHGGMQRAWQDAAEFVDGKWERAAEAGERVKDGYRGLLDDPDGTYSLSASTHDLLVRWLSALPLQERPKLVTTDGEFHSLRRQLARLEEEGLEIVRVAQEPADQLGERLAAATDDRTAAVLTSTVFFRSARIVGDLSAAAAACRRHGALLLLDTYHQLQVVPFSLRDRDLLDAYVVGGGYKYCQLGEGNAFLRAPAGCDLRPVITGWFADFGRITGLVEPGGVGYGDDRFAGATYDPVSHYRGAEVFRFFEDQALDVEFLRGVSQHQIHLLAERFDALDLDPGRIERDRAIPLESIGGFLPLGSTCAGDLHHALRDRGVWTDFRDDVLRLGPAPYVSDRQIVDGIEALGEAARALGSTSD